jgi:hypothetical protein
MTTICKADYYYGVLLSALVNGGFAPALFEKENDNRRIKHDADDLSYEAGSKLLKEWLKTNNIICLFFISLSFVDLFMP